jgi:hypothetical protein
VVPAGGLSPDHTRWIAARTGFVLPVRVLSRVFRGKFVAGLRELHAAGKLGFHGGLVGLAAPAAFASWLRGLFRSDWVVYAKRPFGGAEHALRYLGCYTHRVAISNHRLVALEDREVVFRWRDSALPIAAKKCTPDSGRPQQQSLQRQPPTPLLAFSSPALANPGPRLTSFKTSITCTAMSCSVLTSSRIDAQMPDPDKVVRTVCYSLIWAC